MSRLFWDGLRQQIVEEARVGPCVVGVCVRDLTDGVTIDIHANEVFPTASTIKIHVLATMMVLAEEGKLDLSRWIHFVPADGTAGSGVLALLENSATLTLLDTAVLMISLSDNTATNVCIDQVGMARVNQLIRDLGLERTMLQRKMMDAESVRADRENVATPAELVEFFTQLHQGKPTAQASRRTLELLKKPKYGFIDRAVPPGSLIANKPGAVEGVRCDAGIVYLPRRPYAVAIMTKYGGGSAFEQDAFIVRLAETIHTRMVAWDESNRYGHRGM